VDGREPRRALVAAEVGREHALGHAPPPQELARAARGPGARRRRGGGGGGSSASSSSSGHGDLGRSIGY
jgi:hypothetical protein